jgi:hypothetical protein
MIAEGRDATPAEEKRTMDAIRSLPGRCARFADAPVARVQLRGDHRPSAHRR